MNCAICSQYKILPRAETVRKCVLSTIKKNYERRAEIQLILQLNNSFATTTFLTMFFMFKSSKLELDLTYKHFFYTVYTFPIVLILFDFNASSTGLVFNLERFIEGCWWVLFWFLLCKYYSRSAEYFLGTNHRSQSIKF